MPKKEESKEKEVGLFRYGIIAELARLEPGTPGLYRLIQERAEREYDIPGSARRRVASETIRDWIKRYRKGGFDALLPKKRSDKGSPRRMSQSVADFLLTLQEEHPGWSIALIIKEAEKSGKIGPDVKLPYTSVHRLLSGRRSKAADPTQTGKDHRRFAYQKAGELFMSDVMHGPSVVAEGQRKRKTYLIAIVDDATRVITHAEFALAESAENFMRVFKTALLRRGLPRRLFVDNGAPYRSTHLAIVCARLGITLIHARAYHPEAKGKIERWFRTVRMQFLPSLRPEDFKSLELLNQKLWAYVEGEYHATPHRGLTGETPLDQWARTADEVKYPADPSALDDLFLCEARRKVMKDRTISLGGVVYEVAAHLVSESVTLRYDPASKTAPIQVWLAGEFIENARQLDIHANCHVKRQRPMVEKEVDVEPQSTSNQNDKRFPTLRFSDFEKEGGDK